MDIKHTESEDEMDEFSPKGEITNSKKEDSMGLSKGKIFAMIGIAVLIFILMFSFFTSKKKNEKPKEDVKVATKTTTLEDLVVKQETEPIDETKQTTQATQEIIPNVIEPSNPEFDSSTNIQAPSWSTSQGVEEQPKEEKKKNASSIGYNQTQKSQSGSQQTEVDRIKAEITAAEAGQKSNNQELSGMPATTSTATNWKLNKNLETNSKYTLFTGTVIPSILWTKLNSDLPGQMVAIVRENVYASNKIVIPQGTKIYGTYDSTVAYAQNRVLVIWNRLIFPNGKTLDLLGMPGVDLTGAAGLNDKINYHTWQTFKGVILSAMFGASSAVIDKKYTSDAANNAASGAADQVNSFGEKITDKILNRPATIEIRQGTKFNIMINKDIEFSSYN